MPAPAARATVGSTASASTASLVSFPVFFQCKRYRGSVTPDKVRDFRGTMAGRGDKGLLITTGTSTVEAKKEATRDGAPPIDLIDGERLCDLLKEHQLWRPHDAPDHPRTWRSTRSSLPR